MTQVQVYAVMVVSAAIVFFVVLPIVTGAWVRWHERKHAAALQKTQAEGVVDKPEPEQDDDERCGTCWKERDGECRAMLPKVLMVENKAVTRWPAVKPYDWCAEYEA